MNMHLCCLKINCQGDDNKRLQSNTQIDVIDFSFYKDIAINNLARVYDTEFKESSQFNELIAKLHKNEIEYKFLEQANVIKGDIASDT